MIQDKEAKISLNASEIEKLANGLDLLARNAKDVLIAAADLIPIRVKLEDAAGAIKKSDGESHE